MDMLWRSLLLLLRKLLFRSRLGSCWSVCRPLEKCFQRSMHISVVRRSPSQIISHVYFNKSHECKPIDLECIDYNVHHDSSDFQLDLANMNTTFD